jgi:preprotein translocase subunit YajC
MNVMLIFLIAVFASIIFLIIKKIKTKKKSKEEYKDIYPMW